MIAATGAHLAVIGEPEAAVAIEDDVVRALERFALEPVVERDHRAGGEVDALDRAAGRLVGGMAREEQRAGLRSVEHTSELQSLMRISYAVFCLKQKKKITTLQYIMHQ